VNILQAVATEDVSVKNSEVSEPKSDLAVLFEQCYPRIYNYLRYRVSSVEDAEDLIGAVFEQAYAHRSQFDPGRGAFSTWLFRIAHNELVSYYRRKTSRSKWETGTEIPADLLTADPSPEAQVVHQEAVVLMLRCVERLSERDQEIISLKFAGKLRNNEISEIMEMPEKTVSVVLLRAVRRLRQEMEKEPAL
jgi:RNA polymerase sigma-70 factor (ECF subfamily)